MTALNPGHTIGQQVCDVLRLHLGSTASQARERALELLEAVQIRSAQTVLRQFPHELSGGMRQRVLIAIAFACKPQLIIADEPTTALDVTVQREVLRLLRDLQRDDGAAVLFITHNLGLVAKLCDSVSVIHSGRIVERGSVRRIIEAPSFGIAALDLSTGELIACEATDLPSAVGEVVRLDPRELLVGPGAAVVGDAVLRVRPKLAVRDEASRAISASEANAALESVLDKAEVVRAVPQPLARRAAALRPRRTSPSGPGCRPRPRPP